MAPGLGQQGFEAAADSLAGGAHLQGLMQDCEQVGIDCLLTLGSHRLLLGRPRTACSTAMPHLPAMCKWPSCHIRDEPCSSSGTQHDARVHVRCQGWLGHQHQQPCFAWHRHNR